MATLALSSFMRMASMFCASRNALDGDAQGSLRMLVGAIVGSVNERFEPTTSRDRLLLARRLSLRADGAWMAPLEERGDDVAELQYERSR